MKYNYKIILAIGLPALCLLVYSIFPQIGLTFDSRLYLDLSKHLLDDGFTQQSFGSKPPLFPIILTTLQRNLMAISIGNILCWIASMYLLLKTINVQFSVPFYKYCFAIMLLFGTPIILVHNFIWTESYYLLIISLFLFTTIHDFKNLFFKNTILAILLLAMVTLKHIGVSTVFAFGLVAILGNPNGWKKIALTYSPAIIFFILWQVKSYLIRGDLSRLTHSENLEVLRNLESIGQVFVHWVYPFQVPFLISVIAVLAILFISFYGLIRLNGIMKYGHGFTLILLIVLITKGDLIPDDTERYLAISFPFLAFFFYNFLSKLTFVNQYFVKSFAVLVVAYTIIRTVKNCILWHHIY